MSTWDRNIFSPEMKVKQSCQMHSLPLQMLCCFWSQEAGSSACPEREQAMEINPEPQPSSEPVPLCYTTAVLALHEHHACTSFFISHCQRCLGWSNWYRMSVMPLKTLRIILFSLNSVWIKRTSKVEQNPEVPVQANLFFCTFSLWVEPESGFHIPYWKQEPIKPVIS